MIVLFQVRWRKNYNYDFFPGAVDYNQWFKMMLKMCENDNRATLGDGYP